MSRLSYVLSGLMLLQACNFHEAVLDKNLDAAEADQIARELKDAGILSKVSKDESSDKYTVSVSRFKEERARQLLKANPKLDITPSARTCTEHKAGGFISCDFLY